MVKKFAEATALKRGITTDEVGNVAAFLLSDWASALTGEILYVDNGFSHMVTGLNDVTPGPPRSAQASTTANRARLAGVASCSHQARAARHVENPAAAVESVSEKPESLFSTSDRERDGVQTLRSADRGIARRHGGGQHAGVREAQINFWAAAGCTCAALPIATKLPLLRGSRRCHTSGN